MEIILILLLLIVILFYLEFCSIDKKMLKNKKEIRKLKKEIKQIKNNEFYIFDYIEGIYEHIERGDLNEKNL